MKKGLFSLLIVAVIMMLGACSEEETAPKEEPKETVKEEAPKEEAPKEEKETETEKVSVNWEEQVKLIASSDKSETEKHDEVVMLAKDHEATEAEVKEFGDFIIQEYKSGKYLSDIKNHEYMLNNLFKSTVVEENLEEGNPMKDFAFDFLQNTKYTYRGVDAVDSSSVKSNEEQMAKALAKMQ